MENSSYYYSLDNMLSIFKEHSKKNEEQMRKNRNDFPDSQWAKDDFNISKAFYSICHEINLLKKANTPIMWDENI